MLSRLNCLMRQTTLRVRRVVQMSRQSLITTQSHTNIYRSTYPTSVAVKVAVMSSTPSSRRSRGHSARKSQSSTPIQQSQGTPSRATGQGNGAAIASSSPVFFQSSPKSTPQQQASQRSQDGMIISSPPRQAPSVADRDATPRASRQAATGERESDSMCNPNTTRIFTCTLRSKL